MKILNNQQLRLIDEIKPLLNTNSEVFIAASYFTIHALYAVHDQIKNVRSIKILIDNAQAENTFFNYDPAEWSIEYELNTKHKAEKILSLIKEKCTIRYGSMGGQKLILVKNVDQTACFSIGPLDLNSVCLGNLPSSAPIIISSFQDAEDQYINIFNQFWNNSSRDAKVKVQSLIEQACANYPPEAIYKFSLYNIFQNSTIDESSDQRIKKIGFKETLVWKMLYNFQQDAVLGAIDKIETFGGCIIADSVGLGKTFEALAIMKYYQMRNDRILVLCPKKLRDNWVVYSQNDVRNILTKDRFNFDVLNHTDLSRTSGTSGDINLETLNWGNYDLIVVDESHNFRNNPPRKDTVTRYQRLMNDIIKSGVKTKVLMLSATPVNTRMNDIKNQIAFITEQDDKAFADEGIPSIDLTLRKAQQKFNSWLKQRTGDNFDRTSLIESLDGSYFKILDLLTIARSRKHIQKYYDTQDIGKFPDRLKPINKYSDFDLNGKFPAIDKVNNELNALNLTFYSPLSYVRPEKRKAYEDKYDMTTSSGSVFRQIERERSLIHLMRVNLLKRLESSVHAFQLTLVSLLEQINQLLEKIDHANSTGFFDSSLDINSIDLDDDLLEDLLVGGKVKVLLQDIDLIKCREEISDDKKRIENLLSLTRVIDSSRDAKLNDLKLLIAEKINNPINEGNKKIIIFSAFADTVKYLYDHLHPWLRNELKVYSAQVTGGDTNKTNLRGCRSDLSSILINFSPLSKSRQAIIPGATEEIDFNLHGCDFRRTKPAGL